MSEDAPASPRIATFKKSISREDNARKREGLVTTIRKSKREDSLRAKRMMMRDSPEPSSEAQRQVFEAAQREGKLVATPEAVPMLVEVLKACATAPEDTVHTAARAMRQLLSRGAVYPVETVIQAGAVPVLRNALSHPSAGVCFEVAWALTNIASTQYTAVVVDAGCVEPMVRLMGSSPDATVREQVAWCLGNIMGDRAAYRDLVIATPGALEAFVFNLTQPANVVMQRNIMWAMSNITRSRPPPSFARVSGVISVMLEILARNEDAVTTREACWALQHFADGAGTDAQDGRLEFLLANNVCQILVAVLRKDGTTYGKHVPPCVKVLGTVLSAPNPAHANEALAAGFLDVAFEVMQHSFESVKKSMCWALSNVAAGTPEQVMALVQHDPRILPQVHKYLVEGVYEVRIESAWVFKNLIIAAPAPVACQVVDELNLVPALCNFLATGAANAQLLEGIMQALERLLQVNTARYAVLIEESDGLEAMEKLQQHSDRAVYEAASGVLERYFDHDKAMCDDDAGAGSGPALEPGTGMFAFQAAQTPAPSSSNHHAGGMDFAGIGFM